jgi:hypothetical protein
VSLLTLTVKECLVEQIIETLAITQVAEGSDTQSADAVRQLSALELASVGGGTVSFVYC